MRGRIRVQIEGSYEKWTVPAGRSRQQRAYGRIIASVAVQVEHGVPGIGVRARDLSRVLFACITYVLEREPRSAEFMRRVSSV